MAKKTKARSTKKPTARTRAPKKRAPERAARPEKRAPQAAARPKARRPEKKRTRTTKVRPGPNPSDLKRPVPEEPVRIQPPPEFVQGRHDATLEENAAPPHIDEPARKAATERESATEHERPRPSEMPARRRAVERAALDANRWVHRGPNERRGGAWQARGHSTMRGR